MTVMDEIERLRNPRLRLPKRIVLGGLSTACIALSACAHAPSQPAAAASSESTVMSSTDAFKPSLASDYPNITPEEMGRRFLKLVDGLKTVDELTPDYVAEKTGLPLKFAPAGKAYSFTLHEPASGWYYGLEYYQSPAAGWKTASLEFNNPADPTADMAPVCGLDFDGYAAALKRMGFAMTPTRDMHGNVLEYHFYRGELDVSVGYREQARSTQTGQMHLCVESISVHGVK